MLKVDSSLNHIPAQREHVIALHESINQPLVNIPGAGAASTGAYVLGTRNDQGSYTSFVYLFQAETRTVVVYVSEPRNLGLDAYRAEEIEALRFVESMGFMTDNLHFPTLAPAEQDIVMSRVPLFRPPEETIDLLEVADESPSPLEPPPPPIPTVSSGSILGISGGPSGMFGGMSEEDSRMFAQLSGASGGFDAPRGPAPDTLNQLPPGFQLAPAPGPSASSVPSGPSAPGPAPAAPGAAALAAAGTSADLAAAPARAAALSPAARARLGRLLGAFGWLLAVLSPNAGCATSKSDGQREREVQSLIDLGSQHLREGTWPSAVKVYGQALELEADNRDALRGSAFAYMQLGRLERAEALYNQAIAADPKWSIPKNELGMLKIQRGRCAEAVPLLEAARKDIFYSTPQYAEHNLALAEHCLGKKQAAVDRLDKLMLRNPQFCLGYLTLSQYAAEVKRQELVVQACQGFEQKCAGDAQISEQVLPEHRSLCYLRSGRAYIQLGDVESARAAFERCGQAGRIGQECQSSLGLLPP